MSFKKLRSGWCSDKRQLNLTLAKGGHDIAETDCESNLETHYSIGQKLNIAGTPAIIYEDGSMELGYRTANQLALELGIK